MAIARLILAASLLLALPARAGEGDALSARLLTAHNAERLRLGIAPLRWSPALADQARVWAGDLARRGTLQHSQDRQGAGENLWMGTSGYYAPEAMVGAFIGERRYFRPGAFPNVSTTGRWSDVGHYTQLIWPETREVGCAVAKGRSFDVLVCRYLPAGNVITQRVP
jgi:uncharacterized protein YkwD